jgi:hypothetical protein
MFDVDARIRDWRQRLIGRLGADVLDELESHLREEMHRAALAGRPLEAAWNDAASRLGSPEGLVREFAKVPSGRPLRWGAAWCVFGLYLLPFLLAGLTYLCAAKRDEREDAALLHAHVTMVCVGYLAVFAFGLLSSFVTLSRLWGGATAPQLVTLRWWGRVYAAIGFVGCLVGFVLGAIWSRERFGLAWSNDASEIGGVVMIAWTLGMLIRFSRSASPSLIDLTLGVAGNPVTIISWFGAAYVKSQGLLTAPFAKPTTFPNLWLGFMVAFFAIHGLLLCLMVVPLPRRGAAPMESGR